ncbi:MFS transporter [Spirillospora sp. NPDC048911]|uniref:MFS transporter n=1 Tax=Spirillospora sp. NPDC048911 TaxID=3364527 RepID=UPI003719666F
MTGTAEERTTAARAMVFPLAFAQFVCSYAATNMNVAISTIADDIGTSVRGIQTTITLFTLTMAALMIAGSKLTDIWGRKACFVAGLVVYGTGALLATLAQGLGLMVIGYSLLEGVGSALLIPPIYILITVAFDDTGSRAKYFGVVSAAAGLGSAAGPLLGGVITSSIGWRASFLSQVLAVAWILVLSRRVIDPPRTGPKPHFDGLGAVLSAAGLFFVVLGVLQSGTYGWFVSREAFTVGDVELIPKGGISPVWVFIAIGAAILCWFFLHVRQREKHHKNPLVSVRLFRDRTSNLGLTTQTIQWLTMQGTFFVISVFLQQVRGFNAIQTGLTLIPATAGILIASAAAERMAHRHSQRRLIRAGFGTVLLGFGLLLLLVREQSNVLTFAPGLLLIGLGIGIMLTASVNVVQSSFPERDQGDISGLSRSVSNLGSSLGTALAGSILVAASHPGGRPFALSLTMMAVITFIGWVVALLIPRRRPESR